MKTFDIFTCSQIHEVKYESMKVAIEKTKESWKKLMLRGDKIRHRSVTKDKDVLIQIITKKGDFRTGCRIVRVFNKRKLHH